MRNELIHASGFDAVDNWAGRAKVSVWVALEHSKQTRDQIGDKASNFECVGNVTKTANIAGFVALNIQMARILASCLDAKD